MTRIPEPPRCSAPLNDGCTDLCGEPATEERVVSGGVFHLCAEHAREVDGDAPGPGEPRLWLVTLREPLEAGRRHVALWSFAAIARTEEEALARVKARAAATVSPASVLRAHAVTADALRIALSSADPTEEELAAAEELRRVYQRDVDAFADRCRVLEAEVKRLRARKKAAVP